MSHDEGRAGEYLCLAELGVPALAALARDGAARRLAREPTAPAAGPFASLPHGRPDLEGWVVGAVPVAAYPLEWEACRDHLEQAHKNAHLGRTLPAMAGLPGPVRRLATRLLELVLSTFRFLIQPQRTYNTEVLDLLRGLQHNVRQLELIQRVNLERLEVSLGGVAERVANLERLVAHLPAAAADAAWPDQRAA
jgi:hypothetical protein